MSKFNQRLRELRNERKLSQQALANILGISKSSINMYERGEREPGLDLVLKLSMIFNASADYLLGKSNDRVDDNLLDIVNEIDDGLLQKYGNIYDAQIHQQHNILPISTQKLPLLGEIACGQPIFTNEDRESYVEVGTNVKADFCLRAKGDSMINARILNGDIVFIKKQSTVENGEIAAVVIDDEATLKRVYYSSEENVLTLTAENPAYPPKVFHNESLDHIHILGKAVAFQSDVK